MPFRSGLWKLPITGDSTCWFFMDRRVGGVLAVNPASCLSLMTNLLINVCSKHQNPYR